jgi:hypothetical protein
MKYKFLIMTILLIASCSRKKDLLHISELRIEINDAYPKITMEKDGKIYIDNDLVTIANKNGVIKWKSGNVACEMGEDNILRNYVGEPLIKINKNGVMDNGSGVVYHWNTAGKFVKGDKEIDYSLVPNDNNLFQVASIIMFLHSGTSILTYWDLENVDKDTTP